MIKEEQINEICIRSSMRRIGISKVPTWIDVLNQEGIEISEGGKVKPFWVKSGERIYNEPATANILKVLELIIRTEKSSDISPVKENIPEPEKQIIKTDSVDAILPETFSPTLMEKWQKMKTIDRMMLFQHTPENKIKYVVVGKDTKGHDVEAAYVEGNYMVREANAAFLFDWKLENVVISVCSTGVSCSGTFSVWFSEYQKYISRPTVGYQELNKKVDVELAKKGATTDAIKKGLSYFGFNSDVYGGEI